LDHFLCDYKVRSLKSKNAVILKFEDNLFSEFVSYLRVFEENHYDAKFKLMAEKQQMHESTKFLDIQAFDFQNDNSLRVRIDVAIEYDHDQRCPKDFPLKEAIFMLDNDKCKQLKKFVRISSIFPDDVAKLVFRFREHLQSQEEEDYILCHLQPKTRHVT